jgi:transcription antitermination protein NusB
MAPKNPHSAGNRRKARECALQILYQMDMSGHSPEEALRAFWQNFTPEHDVEEFATALVEGVATKQADIDKKIQEASHHWKLERMAKVDRNVLRLAVYELLFREDIPKKVTLNEAIEIAKRYGTEESGSFINGVLDHIGAAVQKE